MMHVDEETGPQGQTYRMPVHYDISECNYLRSVRSHMDTYPTWMMDPSCIGSTIVRQHQIPDNGREELSNESCYLMFVCTRTVAVAMDHP